MTAPAEFIMRVCLFRPSVLRLGWLGGWLAGERLKGLRCSYRIDPAYYRVT